MRTRAALQLIVVLGFITAVNLARSTPTLAATNEAASVAIPPMEMSAALSTFAKRTGLQIMYVSKAASGVMSQGAPGDLSPEETLKHLLSGTHLQYRFINAATVTISDASAEYASEQVSQQSTVSSNSQLSGHQENSEGIAQQSTVGPVAGLEEVIVTARKRAENLQSVPETVTAITSTVVERAGIRDINDLRMLASGVIINNESNLSDLSITVRGVGSFGNVPGLGVYYDEVQTFSGFGERLNEIERVELLKGPQGTLYGGANIGGALKFVLKQPQYDWHGELEATGGSRDTYDLFGAITGPIIDDKLAFRLAAYGSHTDGDFFDILRNGARVGAVDQQGARLALRADPSDNLHVNLGLRLTALNDGSVNLYPIVPSSTVFTRDVYSPGRNILNRWIIAPTLNVEWEFADGYRFTSISSYNAANDKSGVDANYTPFPTPPTIYPNIHIALRIRDQVVTQEARIASPQDQRFSWLVGAYYLHRNYSQGQLIGIGDNTGTLFPPAVLGLPSNPFPNYTDTVTEQYAGFASGTYHFNDKLDLTVGGRVNRAIQTFTNPVMGQYTAAKGTSFLPKASLSYKINPDVMGYFTFSQGLQPGGVALAGTAGLPFRPEKTTNYEVGVKAGLLDNRLQVNAAFFYTNYHDRTETEIVVNQFGNFDLDQNIGDSTNIGVDTDVAFKVFPELTLRGGFSWVQAHWNSGVMYTPTSALPLTNIGGTQAADVPEYSGILSADWEHPLTADLTFQARADVSYTGKFYWDVLDTISQPAYALVNVSTGFAWKTWNIAFEGRNVTNKQYNLIYVIAQDTGSLYNISIPPPDTRTWLVKLSTHF